MSTQVEQKSMPQWPSPQAAPTAEQLLDGAQFVQHRGGGIYRTCAEWDAAGVFVPLAKWQALTKHLASGVPLLDGGQHGR